MDNQLEEMKKSFFGYIEERQRIWYKRNVEKLPPPWTEDPILQIYRFCNAFRELDAGTKSIIDHVIRNDGLDLVDKLYNIILYRWHNIRYLYDYIQPCKLNEHDFDRTFNLLQQIKSDGKIIFNPAYVVSCNDFHINKKKYAKYIDSPCGTKICGLYSSLDDVMPKLEKICDVLKTTRNYETALNVLTNNIRHVGKFIALQILLDLSYTHELAITENDIEFIGEGAVKGCNYILGYGKNYGLHLSGHMRECISLLHSLHEEQNQYLSESFRNIVPIDEISCMEDGKLLSLQNIEFNLCEFRKYNSYKVNENKHHRKMRFD